MHFVGVDLAWGQQKPTGVAVLDAQGELLLLASETDDDAIASTLGPYVEGPCLVGIDAPLIVRNATGNRPCEAALNRDFARFDAGAHPSNTGKPELSGTPRGARLAARLGLEMDPASSADRRAIEVYPHPATVALFRLGRTLKYKQRPNRTLPQLRSELMRLVTLLEGLDEATPPLRLRQSERWRKVAEDVASAPRKSDLRRAEDQVDAVVCAYVSMLADHQPGRITVYGDVETGYIVTPTLPEDLVPSPRVSSGRGGAGESRPSVPVSSAVQQYAELQPRLREVTDQVVDLVTTLLDDAGINYLSVTGRAKSVASFAAKADRTVGGRPLFADPLEEITDQVGVRVITYIHSDVAAVADLLRDQLTILDDRDMGQETARQGRFGYASRHLLVTSGDDGEIPTEAEVLRGHRAQVQVRTVLQHAWAEFEHAIRYKGTVPEEHASDLDRRFTLAAGLLELADREFSLIRDRLQETVPETPDSADLNDPRISPQALATFLTNQYSDAGWSRPEHYSWVSGLLLELGITSLEELAGLLTSVDNDAINERMAYRYPPGAVRRLDDSLLAIFGTGFLDLKGNAHRRSLLQARLEKIRTPMPQPES